jgi:hypothetical protein
LTDEQKQAIIEIKKSGSKGVPFPETKPEEVRKMSPEEIDKFIKEFSAKARAAAIRRGDTESIKQLLTAKKLHKAPKKRPASYYKTKTVDYYKRGDMKIPITMRQTPESHIYPVSPDEVKATLDKIPIEQIKGMKEISFRPPSRLPFTEQTDAWAQYANKANRLNIYSEPFKITKKHGLRFKKMHPHYDELHEGRRYMLGFVIPHEIGHHHALDHLGYKDDPQLIAEARADAIAYRENPHDAKVIRKYAKKRLKLFGS